VIKKVLAVFGMAVALGLMSPLAADAAAGPACGAQQTCW
jgi:hypothetical protein